MDSNRPFLLQSPRTPNTQELLPSIHVFPELPKSKSSSSNTVTFAGVDSSNPIENPPNYEASWNLKNSSSQRSNMSSHSGSSGSTKNSVKEVSFGHSGSKPVRYGSKGADSEGLSMSQKELRDEDARLVYINDPEKTNERFEFSGNSIRTAKYSILTFIPRNLFEQFHRVAYIYFLIIAILNQLPQLAVFGGVVSVLPLAFVLIVTAVKDAYEDWRRHRADKVENNRLASVLINGELIEKKWKDIRVGEIIKIKLKDNVWDEFGETDDHIVPHAGDAHKDQFAIQGDSCKKSLQELQGIKRSTDYVSNYGTRGKEELYLPNLNQKERMLEKGSSWSHKPEGLFSSCDGDSCKELKRLTSDNTKMSDHCFKCSNIDSSGSELCADDTIMGNKCVVEDDSVSQYSINQASQIDNELSFLDNDFWLDIGNFEDVDRTLSCDLTFGMESLDNEEGFTWLSSSHGTEGSDDALKSGFKFASAEMCQLKSISDYNIALKENIEGLPINDCNQKTTPIDEKLRSQMDVDHDAVPALLSMFSESDMISGNTDDMMPKEKGKMSKPLAGKRKNLENGDSVRPYAHMEQYEDLKQPFVASSNSIQKHRPNMDSSMPIQNSQMNQNCCEYDYSLGASGNFVCSDSQLLNGGFKSENMASPLPFQNPGSAQQVCRKIENENEGHSEVGGVSIGFSQIDSSNLQESSSLSSAMDNISLEAASFCQLQRVMDQLDIRTKLCIRDSLYRLAKSAEQRNTDANTNGQIGDVETCKAIKTPDANRRTGFIDMETNTNPIDRSIAHLLFHRPSDPSMFPRNDTILFNSSSMVHGLVTNLPAMTETQVCQEESSAGAEKKSLEVTPS